MVLACGNFLNHETESRVRRCVRAHACVLALVRCCVQGLGLGLLTLSRACMGWSRTQANAAGFKIKDLAAVHSMKSTDKSTNLLRCA